jgi:hypothetical protein
MRNRKQQHNQSLHPTAYSPLRSLSAAGEFVVAGGHDVRPIEPPGKE